MCVNQRLVYLQRMLGLRHGEAAFGRFDDAVMDKVMELLGVHLQQGRRREFRDRIAALRSLPTHLSGGAVRSIAGVHARVKMLYLCRDNIARFFHKQESLERVAIVRGQWRAERLPIMTVEAAADPAPAQSEEVDPGPA